MSDILAVKVPITINLLAADLEHIVNKLVFIPVNTPKKISDVLMYDKRTRANIQMLNKYYDIDMDDTTVHGGDTGAINDADIVNEYGSDLIDADVSVTFDDDDIYNIINSSSLNTSSEKKKKTPIDDIGDTPSTRTDAPSTCGLNKYTTASSNVLFECDTITTFKHKIYIDTGIPPYLQHIWVVFNGVSYPLSYRILNDTYQNIDITSILYINTVLEDIPVDSSWYASKADILVESYDHLTIGQILDKYNTFEFNMVCLPTYINTSNYMSLRKLIMSDTHSCELIYWGFVVKYFPMMSLDVFRHYIKNPKSISEHYPNLHPNIKQLTDKYNMEKSLLTTNIPKYKKDIIKTNIINSTIHVGSNYVNDDIIILRNIFDLYKLNDVVQTCVCLISHGINTVTLVKKYKSYEAPYKNIPLNTIQFSIVLPNCGNVIMQINKVDNYKIICNWSEGLELTFDGIFKAIHEHINPILSTINNLGPVAYTQPLELVTITNSRFVDIGLTIYVKKQISTVMFNTLKKHISDFVSAGILEQAEVIPNTLHYYQLKGMYVHNINKYRANSSTQNEYSIYHDPESLSRWHSFVVKKKQLKITRRYGDIKIEVIGLREVEYKTWYTLLQLMLIPILSDKLEAVDSIDETRVSIRSMKEIDPILYDLKKIYGKKIVYAQNCQKQHQPNIHNKSGTGRIKYINFTTNEPTWYSCPNPKYPILYFKTGIHPLNYCMPCCKKKELPKVGSSTHAIVYNKCIAPPHTYDSKHKEYAISRHIKTYSRYVYPGRLSKLPERTLGALLHSKSMVYTSDGNRSRERMSDYYVYGVHQHTQSASDIGFIQCIINALDITLDKFIADTIDMINGGGNTWMLLLDRSIIKYYISKESFVNDILAIFTKDYLSTFTMWNMLFIDIVKVYWNINVVMFVGDSIEHTSNTSTDTHDVDLHLHVGKHITCVSEYFTHSRSIVVINRNTTYYPIYDIDVDEYFKSSLISKKIYMIDDSIIVAVSNMLQYEFSKSSNTFKSIDLHFIKYFTKHNDDISIHTLYINNTNTCYGITLMVDNVNPIHIPIGYSVYTSGYKLSFDVMGDSHSNDWNILKKIIDRMNISIAEYSRDNGRSITRDNSVNIIDSVSPIYPYITYTDWASYMGSIIGFRSQSMLFYVDVKTINTTDIKPSTAYVVDPYVANTSIKNRTIGNIIDKMSYNINKALYSQYLYNLLFMTFMDIIHTHRNKKIRSDILKLSTSIRGKKHKITTSVIEKLKTILVEYPNDIHPVLKIMLSDNPETVLNKSYLEFDKYVILSLVKLPIDKCVVNIHNIMSAYVVAGTPDYKQPITNTISSCINIKKNTTGDAMYCDGKKLIIPKDKLDDYINILASDIKNPLKNKYITSYAFIPKYIEFFNFVRNPNEIIYVSF